MSRNGKIAGLPAGIREQLNVRLADGVDGKSLLPWLNGLPEVKASLAEGFGGVPISAQNLSDWRKGGFAEWQVRSSLVGLASGLKEDASALESLTRGEERSFGDMLALSLEAQYAGLVKSWDGTDKGFQSRLDALNAMCMTVSRMRRENHVMGRLWLSQQKEAARAADMELRRAAVVMKTTEWAKGFLLEEARYHRNVKEAFELAFELMALRVEWDSIKANQGQSRGLMLVKAGTEKLGTSNNEHSTSNIQREGTEAERVDARAEWVSVANGVSVRKAWQAALETALRQAALEAEAKEAERRKPKLDFGGYNFGVVDKVTKQPPVAGTGSCEWVTAEELAVVSARYALREYYSDYKDPDDQGARFSGLPTQLYSVELDKAIDSDRAVERERFKRLCEAAGRPDIFARAMESCEKNNKGGRAGS